jgi:stearoyl-CoA desaturase (delta-9 desaturase)
VILFIFLRCRKVQAVENTFVSTITAGEGWHNFHHVFPSDYRASEYGHKCDVSTAFIGLMKKIGWASDLKETPQNLVNNWIKKYGDGSPPTKY